MSAFDNIVRGELKLKGDDGLDKKRKRKKKNKRKEKEEVDEEEEQIAKKLQADKEAEGEKEPQDEKVNEHQDEEYDGFTAAERAYRLAQQKREGIRVNERLKLTHRERMKRFNEHLATLSEHFDTPKIGPG